MNAFLTDDLLEWVSAFQEEGRAFTIEDVYRVANEETEGGIDRAEFDRLVTFARKEGLLTI